MQVVGGDLRYVACLEYIIDAGLHALFKLSIF